MTKLFKRYLKCIGWRHYQYVELGNSEVKSIVEGIVYEKMTYFLEEHKPLAVELINKALKSASVREAARKAKEAARSGKKIKEQVILSGKLTPAQSKNYKLNELFIVEGDSAGGSAKNGRDHMHQAILPLRGKPLNVDGLPTERVLKNEEFATIINTIGAGFGQNFDVSSAKYGKIIIMTDADTDGAHIQTLLLTFFYHYMRQLITSGMVYVAVPPLYRVFKDEGKGKNQIYCWSNEDLAKAKLKIGAGYKVSRYKGLGEMNADQLRETTMKKETRQLIQVNIEDPLLVGRRISVLMGSDTSLRKQWIEENVNFNEVDDFKNVVKHG